MPASIATSQEEIQLIEAMYVLMHLSYTEERES